MSAEKKLSSLEVIKVRRAPETLTAEDRAQSCERIKTHLLGVLREMLVHPEKVSVEWTLGEQTSIFQIDIAFSDYGRLVGAKGKNISALRTIVLSMSAAKGHRSVLSIKDEEKYF